jgi:hypothetical protein
MPDTAVLDAISSRSGYVFIIQQQQQKTMTINLLKAIFISTILITTATLFAISRMGGTALAKVKVTPFGGTAGGVGLPPMGLGQGGSGGLFLPGSIDIVGHGSGGGGSGGGFGEVTLCGTQGCTVHGGGSGGKP